MSDRRRTRTGTIYLLHLDPPYRHAAHYIGFVAGGAAELTARITQHERGCGSPLVAAALAAGGRVVVARVWERRTRDDERRLKRHHSARDYCELCTPARPPKSFPVPRSEYVRPGRTLAPGG